MSASPKSPSYAYLSSYRPQDLSFDEVKQRHVKAWTAYKADLDSEKLLEAYHDTRDKFKAVMRHYFTEKSKSPVTWFAMRLKYTRSVATNSIVGHILGLGDRHTSNILLDNGTGEVVHIDLGIAFDQVGNLSRYWYLNLISATGQTFAYTRTCSIPHDSRHG